MPLSQEVVDRLLVAKGLLARIRFIPAARPDRIYLAQAILTAHDAAELAIAAIAHHLKKLPPKPQSYLMDYFPLIEGEHPGETVVGRDYFSQLNTVRIAIKHKGIFPDPQQWYRVGERTHDYVSDWCKKYLGFSLDELDESALIANREVKVLYDDAMDAFQQGQYKESLEHLSFATDALFTSNQALRNLRVGLARAEDAIKLAAFGVHANDYLALQEFLPSVVYSRELGRDVIRWNQQKYGHPGNWTREAAEFSLKTFVDVAIRIQDAVSIPGAIAFEILYEHKITALDDLEIFQEATGLLGTLTSQKRKVIKTLKKGESIRCYISRKSILSAPFGSEVSTLLVANRELKIWGEVETDKVRVTCVPLDLNVIKKHFPDLPEIDYSP